MAVVNASLVFYENIKHTILAYLNVQAFLLVVALNDTLPCLQQTSITSMMASLYDPNYTRKSDNKLYVFELLVPSYQQVWDKLLVTCNNLVDIIRLVAKLFQQVQYSHDTTILIITILLQPSLYRDACDVTLSVYLHRATLKNMPGHGGNRTYCTTFGILAQCSAI